MCYSILFKLGFLSNAIISLWVIFSWLRFYLPCWKLEFSWGCLNKALISLSKETHPVVFHLFCSCLDTCVPWLLSTESLLFFLHLLQSTREMPAFLSLALFLCVASAPQLLWPLPWWRLLSPRTQSDVLDSRSCQHLPWLSCSLLHFVAQSLLPVSSLDQTVSLLKSP